MALTRSLPTTVEGTATAPQAATTALQMLAMAVMASGDGRALREVPDAMAVNKRDAAMVRWLKDFHADFGHMPSPALLESAHGVRWIAQDLERTSVRYLSDRAAAHAVVHRLQDLTAKSQQSLASGLRAGDIIAGLRGVLNDCGLVVPAENVVSLVQAGEAVIREYLQEERGEAPKRIPFGMPSLDATTGGMTGDDLDVLVAYTNVGKTHYLISMAVHAWKQGHDVLFVSNEMDALPIARRVFGQLSGLNPDFIRRAALSSHAYAKLVETARVPEGKPRFDFLAGGFGLKVGALRRAVERLRPAAVYTDGMYLMVPEDDRFRQYHERQFQLAGELKGICKDTLTPMMGTLQFNREHSKAEKVGKGGKEKNDQVRARRVPDLHTLAGSAAWEQNASLILGMAYGDDPHERDRRRFWDMKRRESAATESWECWMRMHPVDLSEVDKSREMPATARGEETWGADFEEAVELDF